MISKIMKFHSEVFGDLRGRYFDGQVWLIGVDVAKALEYKNTKDALAKHVFADYKCILNAKTIEEMASRCKGRKVRPLELETGTTSPRGLLYINEAGLYQLIFASKMPKAIEFQRWVYEEVLPSLRRTGEYRMEWDEARAGGKVTRRKLTDTLADLFRYAVERDEFHHEDGILYANYSKLINKVVGVNAGERDNLPAKQLFELDTCEHICAKVINASMTAGKSHHDIYEACKAKLEAWRTLTE